MARKVEGPAQKGSRKWLQYLVNQRPEVLNSKIIAQLGFQGTEVINWLTPLADDDFAEYQDQDFLTRLRVELPKVPLPQFWPARGPVWDALGRSDSGNLFLVEAKSHIDELVSPKSGASSGSRDLISKSLKKCKEYLNSESDTDWTGSFYQCTNRLAHLFLLRELNGLPAFLVFVYFVNDSERKGPESEEEWKGAIKLLHSYLGIGRTKLTPFIADVFIDVKSLSIGK